MAIDFKREITNAAKHKYGFGDKHQSTMISIYLASLT